MIRWRGKKNIIITLLVIAAVSVVSFVALHRKHVRVKLLVTNAKNVQTQSFSKAEFDEMLVRIGKVPDTLDVRNNVVFSVQK